MMVTQGSEYVEQSQAEYEAKYQERTFNYLQQKAKSLEFDMIDLPILQ
ncbi:MAG: hypothetical protein ACXW0H_07535 [Methylobacter sp.]